MGELVPVCTPQAHAAAVHGRAGGAAETLPTSGWRETDRREGRIELRLEWKQAAPPGHWGAEKVQKENVSSETRNP